MSETTPNPYESMLRPPQVLAILSQELPADLVPPTGDALVQRWRRGHGPPFHQDPKGGEKAPLVADREEVLAWCRAQWPPAAHAALERSEAFAALLRDLGNILAKDECICNPGQYRSTLADEDGQHHSPTCSLHLAWRIRDQLERSAP